MNELEEGYSSVQNLERTGEHICMFNPLRKDGGGWQEIQQFDGNRFLRGL